MVSTGDVLTPISLEIDIALELWGRNIKSTSELNPDGVKYISDKYGEDCLSAIDIILTENWDKWNQQMEDYFKKHKESNNNNGVITSVQGI